MKRLHLNHHGQRTSPCSAFHLCSTYSDMRYGRYASTSAQSDDSPVHPSPRAALQPVLRKTVSMLTFMAPALILPLSDPLMSLIDAISLGKYAGTVQLAALGPTSVVFSFSSYVFNSLAIATTSKVSADLAAGDERKASATASAAIAIAIAAGSVCLVALKVFGGQIIAATGAVPELLAPATAYLQVRAAAQPALLVSLVAQSCLLAQRDSRSPAAAVLLQVIVNAGLDVFLIVQAGAGVVGAAWATVAAQYLGMALLLWRVQATGRVRLRLVKGLAGRLRELWRTLAPLVVVYVARNLCYMRLQLAAAALVPTQLAAHQAVWSLYTMASFATTTLEQAGLAFLPRSKGPADRRQTELIIRGLGVGIGTALGAACWGVACFACGVFTPDPAVHGFMRQVAPWCGMVMVLVGTDVSAQALLISSGLSGYLARSFSQTLVALFVFMHFTQGRLWGLTAVWAGLVFFFGVRCLQSNIGAMFLRKTREA
eukprot:jgi/Ulvmu1/12718/UM095_0022.1